MTLRDVRFHHVEISLGLGLFVNSTSDTNIKFQGCECIDHATLRTCLSKSTTWTVDLDSYFCLLWSYVRTSYIVWSSLVTVLYPKHQLTFAFWCKLSAKHLQPAKQATPGLTNKSSTSTFSKVGIRRASDHVRRQR